MNKKHIIRIAIVVFIFAVLYIIDATGYERSWDIQTSVSQSSDGDFFNLELHLPAGMYQAEILGELHGDIEADIVSAREDQKIIKIAQNIIPKQSGNSSYIINFELKERTSNIGLKIKNNKEPVYIDRIVIKNIASTAYIDRAAVVGVLLTLLIFGIYMLRRSVEKTLNADILLLLTVVVLVSIPVFLPYLPYGDDLDFHLNRIEGLEAALSNGMIPARIYPDAFGGYGYAAPSYYPDLFLYFPAILRLAGVSLVKSFQLFIFAINCFTAIFMFTAARKMFLSSKTAFYATVLYLCAPYRLCDIYDRCAIGEALAMMFLPLAIYGVYAVIWGEHKDWWILMFGMSGILQSHILTFGLMGLGCFLVGLTMLRKLWLEKRLRYILMAGFCVVLLNLWWLAAFYTFQNVPMQMYKMQARTETRAIYLTQLLFAYPDATSYMNLVGEAVSFKPLSIGIVTIIGCLVLFCYKFQRDIQDVKQRMAVICVVAGAFSAYCATVYFPWNLLSQISVVSIVVRFIQFPWRFLAFATPLLVFGAAYGFCKLSRENNVLVRIFVTTLSLSFALYIIQTFAENWIVVRNGESVNNYYRQQEYLLEETDPDKLINGKYKVSGEEVQLISHQKQGAKIELEVRTGEEGYVEVPLLNYPGYVCKTQQSNKLKIENGENNVVRIMLPSNYTGTIYLKNAGLWYWNLASIISAVSLILLVGYLYFRKKKLLNRNSR